MPQIKMILSIAVPIMLILCVMLGWYTHYELRSAENEIYSTNLINLVNEADQLDTLMTTMINKVQTIQEFLTLPHLTTSELRACIHKRLSKVWA